MALGWYSKRPNRELLPGGDDAARKAHTMCCDAELRNTSTLVVTDDIYTSSICVAFHTLKHKT